MNPSLEDLIDTILSKNSLENCQKEEFLLALEKNLIAAVLKTEGGYTIESRVQQAITTLLKLSPCQVIQGFPYSFDKIDLQKASVHQAYRQLPGAIVRRGAFIDEQAILMPSFINIGAQIGKRTMIDTWSTIGSCAYIGQDCHISGGVGIGGVLEPAGSKPVIIEDHCFIGARSEIAEGVEIGHHSVLATGVFLTASTKIYNKMTKKISYGKIPPYSVVIPGTLKVDESASINAAIIVKYRDQGTSAKVALNNCLRENIVQHA